MREPSAESIYPMQFPNFSLSLIPFPFHRILEEVVREYSIQRLQKKRARPRDRVKSFSFPTTSDTWKKSSQLREEGEREKTHLLHARSLDRICSFANGAWRREPRHAAGLEASPPSPPFFSNFVSLFSLSLYQLALSASLSPAYVREKQERPKNSSETDRREKLFPLSVRPLPVILVKTLRLARGQAARGSAIRGWPSNHPRAPREGEKILSFSGSIGYFRFLGLSRSWIAVLSERKRGGSGDFRS